METLKLILGITGTDEDDLLTYCLQIAEYAVKAYCNISELNDELEAILPQIAAAMYRRNKNGETTVTEIAEGDRRIHYSASAETTADTATADTAAPNYRTVLNRYRNIKGRVPTDLDT